MITRCSTNDEVWQAVTAAQEKQRREGGFGLVLDDSKPAAIITSERYEELWKAILARCEELQKQPGCSPDMRSAGGVGYDGREMSAVVKVRHDNGTSSAYHVGAHLEGPHQRDRIRVTVDGPWLDSHDGFWAGQAADRSNAVVIAGEHYRVSPDKPACDRDLAGHGGRLFRIRNLATGAVTETRNLWYQGIIPPSWRDRLPDNAEFVTADSLAATEAAR